MLKLIRTGMVVLAVTFSLPLMGQLSNEVIEKKYIELDSMALFSPTPLHSFYQSDYYKRLPLFCKFEYKMEKSAKLPVRIRLGSLDYVNKLEGK